MRKKETVTKKEWFGLLIMIALITWFSFSGCTAPPVKQETKTEVKALWDSKPNGKELTEITLKALETYGAGMLAVENVNDAQTYCPKYSTLTQDQRKAFYVYLISAIALRESDFNSSEKYVENFKDIKGVLVVSRGLLQISMESANQKAYGCGIQKAEDLHDDGINLSCGVRILNYWIPRDKVVGATKLGGARYWSVLRESSKSRDFIIQKLKQLTFCQ